MQEILDGPERRRRWSDAEKIAIVVEAAEPGVTVAEVARRHALSRQQVYQWRSAMRQGRLVDASGGPFLAVEFVGGATPAAGDDVPLADGPRGDLLIEVMVRQGRVLRAPASLSSGVLTCLIRAVEAA